MENSNRYGMEDKENLRGQEQNTEYQSQKANADGEHGADQQTSGDDITSEGVDQKHHQQHGNRKYESYTNHSSADDQPQNTTDTNLGREHDF